MTNNESGNYYIISKSHNKVFDGPIQLDSYRSIINYIQSNTLNGEYALDDIILCKVIPFVYKFELQLGSEYAEPDGNP